MTRYSNFLAKFRIKFILLQVQYESYFYSSIWLNMTIQEPKLMKTLYIDNMYSYIIILIM